MVIENVKELTTEEVIAYREKYPKVHKTANLPKAKSYPITDTYLKKLNNLGITSSAKSLFTTIYTKQGIDLTEDSRVKPLINSVNLDTLLHFVDAGYEITPDVLEVIEYFDYPDAIESLEIIRSGVSPEIVYRYTDYSYSFEVFRKVCDDLEIDMSEVFHLVYTEAHKSWVYSIDVNVAIYLAYYKANKLHQFTSTEQLRDDYNHYWDLDCDIILLDDKGNRVTNDYIPKLTLMLVHATNYLEESSVQTLADILGGKCITLDLYNRLMIYMMNNPKEIDSYLAMNLPFEELISVLTTLTSKLTKVNLRKSYPVKAIMNFWNQE